MPGVITAIPDASLVSSFVLPWRQREDVDRFFWGHIGRMGAPKILRQELYHLVLKAARRHGLRPGAAGQLIASFNRMEIQLVDTDDLLDDAFAVAQEIGTGLFDTVYLLTAIRFDAELWTLDEAFLRAAAPRFGEHLRTLT